MDLARLNLAVRSVDGASLVEAEGELGPWTTEALSDALRAAASESDSIVILDLTRVGTIDLGALKVLQQACLALGPERKLCAIAHSQARRMFEMTRFDELIRVYPKLRDALDSERDISGGPE